jgi:hypothetical protein
MYDVIYEAEIALCNINKQPLQLIPLHLCVTFYSLVREYTPRLGNNSYNMDLHISSVLNIKPQMSIEY